MKNGVMIIDKPKGLTSHDVVDYVRGVLKIRRVGHSGTLDPMATGVLVLLIGEATKLFKRFLSFDKEYIATLTLGKVTDTGDAYGKVIKDIPPPPVNEDIVNQVFREFIGEVQQIPPMVSAVRYRGKRLYHFARRGIEIDRQPRKVVIKELKLLRLRHPEIQFYIRCSTGTYIRQLASDIANRLGCGGYISEIERQSVGPYHIRYAINLDQVNESHIWPWQGQD